jgi:hypothetical protein
MRKIECWRWWYRDPQLSCIRQTTAVLTEHEAAEYLDAERIEGTLSLREIDDEVARSAGSCATTAADSW